MPDSNLGLRPVVRKTSSSSISGVGSNKDLLSRFERRGSGSESLLTTAPKKTAASLLARKSSVKTSKTARDSALENKVLQWIISVVNEEPTGDYEKFIQDGSVLSKVMTSIVFNSVPMEDIEQSWGSNPAHDRVKAVIREIKRYGVVDVFEAEDLIELRNISKVTKCLAQLSKLAASDKDNLLNCAQ